jgi:hypothetical protein
MFALVDWHTAEWTEMEALTLVDKQKYADKHGYTLFSQIDRPVTEPVPHSLLRGIHMGFYKIFFLEMLMDHYPKIEWWWFSGLDVLITNHNIKLESIADNNYHFIITRDGGSPIADSFMIRNSPEGKEYLQHIKHNHYRYENDSEQGTLVEDQGDPKWQAITKYVPQCIMNSYALQHYPHLPRYDMTGTRSWWEPGDFALHAINGYTPGFNREQQYQRKVDILKEHVPHIIY